MMRWTLVCAAWLVACGNNSESGTTVDTASAGCQSDGDCPKGHWCAGASDGCDAIWQCTPDIPCSAAAPFQACTCGGVYKTLAAGCPEEKYAWRDDSSWQKGDDGEACDAADEAGFRYTARVTLEGAEKLTAKYLVGRLVPEGGKAFGDYSANLSADASLTWDDALRPSWGKVRVLVLAINDDVSGCDPAKESAWQAELAWTERPAGDVVEAKIVLGAADPAACAAWNE